MSVCLLILPIS